MKEYIYKFEYPKDGFCDEYADSFVEDVRYHAERGDDLNVEFGTMGGTMGYIEVRLASGRNFQSGSRYWSHDNSKINIIKKMIISYLPEDMFVL